MASRGLGKVALLTGASGGLGQKLAPLLSSSGYRMALQGRDEKRLRLTSKACLESGAKENDVFTVTGDLTREAAAKDVIDRTVEHFGRLDVLINNAGLSRMDDLENTTSELLETLLDCNIKPTVFMSKHAVNHLAQTKGVIVNMSSAASLRSIPELMTYGLAKAAVDYFTKHIAVELGPKGIRVNGINPVEILTEPYPGQTAEEYEEWNKHSSQAMPLRRIATSEDIANVIHYLVGDQASYLSGVCLPVDGAFTQTFRAPWQ